MKRIKRYSWHYLFGMILAMVLCIFRMDTSTDCVLEMARTAVWYKGDFLYSPFTGEVMEKAVYWTPMTWVYANLARIFDVHPVLIGKFLMPLIVMFLFVTVWSILIEQLLGKNLQAKTALWILLISSMVFCFSTEFDFTGLWESPWTDKSLVIYIVIPLLGIVIIKTIMHILNSDKIKMIYEIRGRYDKYFTIRKKVLIAFLILWILSVIAAIGLNGCILFNSTYAFPDNRFKMDKEIMDIREMVEDISEVKMLAPFEVAVQIQDCDAKVQLVCGNPKELNNIQSIDEALKKYHDANVIVLPKVDADESTLYNLGYLKLGNTKNYEIYKFVPDLGKYTVTQYASVTGAQSMIYTITDWNNHFIIIDGGWKEDTDWLLKCIKDNGGKVDVWIITHPHPDHAGAFNGVYASGVVEIGTIYTIPMDYEIYQSRANWWDEFEIYDEFVNLTAEADNIVYLNDGDEVDLFGLKMEVFHSFDLEEMENDMDPCNDGGLVFKLSALHSSMLFLADVGGIYSTSIIEKYEDKLVADYVQMGHHGNGGMDETFYRVVSPKMAFFDAPESLMQNEELNAPAKRALMESLDAQVVYYATAPNEIVLQ